MQGLAFWQKAKMHKTLSCCNICFIYKKESRNVNNSDIRRVCTEGYNTLGIRDTTTEGCTLVVRYFRTKEFVLKVGYSNKQNKRLFLWSLYVILGKLFIIQRWKYADYSQGVHRLSEETRQIYSIALTVIQYANITVWVT